MSTTIPISSIILRFLEEKQTEIHDLFKTLSKNKKEIQMESYLLTIFMKSGVKKTVEFKFKQMAPLMISCVMHTLVGEKPLEKYLNGDKKTEIVVDNVAGFTIISDGFRLNPSDLDQKETKELDNMDEFYKKYPSLSVHPKAKHMVSMIGFFENATLIRDIEILTAMGRFNTFGLISDQWLKLDEMANGITNPFAQKPETLEALKKIPVQQKNAVVKSIVGQVNEEIQKVKKAKANRQKKLNAKAKKEEARRRIEEEEKKLDSEPKKEEKKLTEQVETMEVPKN